MTERRMRRIARSRRTAQGIGALAGTMTAFAILGALFGEDMKQEAGKLATEVGEKIPEPAKNAIAEAKGKLGL